MKRVLTVFLLFLGWAVLAKGPVEGWNYRFHTMPETSYHAGIHSIAKDTVGRIWFSGYDAVYRYDGNSFKRQDGQISSILPSDCWTFGQLATDGRGGLFLASNHGLLSYDYLSGEFGVVAPGNIGSLVTDGDGSIWFVKAGRACRMRNGEIVALPVQTRCGHEVSLMASSQGNVFAALGDSLFVFDRQTQECRLFACLSLPDTQIKDVEEYAGDTYVVTLFDGVFEFDRTGQVMRHFILPGEYGRAASAKELYADPSGIIWVSTQSGILLIDSRSGDTRLIRADLRDPFSLPNDSVWDIYPDPDGGIWIGTFGGKLAYTTRDDGNGDRLFKASAGGLGHPIVSCFAEDGDGNLWIGTEGGGISIWDRKAGTFRCFTLQDGSGLNSNMIKHLEAGGDGSMWVSSFNGGVQKIAPGASRFTDVCPGASASQGMPSVYDFIRDGHFLWMTDPDAGLMKMDLRTHEFSDVRIYDLDGNAVDRLRPETLFMDGRGHLWLVTHNGLYEVEPRSCTVLGHRLIPNAPYSANDLCSFCCDSQGNYWLGSRGGGVNVLRVNGDYAPFSAPDGSSLAGKTVFGILEDPDSGDIWFSTNEGLYVYSPEQAKLSLSQIDTPSLCGAYYARSCFLTSKGEMIFGSTNGFLLFTPSHIRFNGQAPEVYVTNFIVNDQRLPEKELRAGKLLKFSHNQNNIEVQFSCNSYLKAENNRYAYRVKGFSEGWVILPPLQRSVQLYNLHPGTYALELKAANSDGLWGRETTVMRFRVKRHPLASWPAYVIYLLLALATALTFLRIVDARRALHHQLEVEQIKERNARELNQARMKFFTNISHDLKTPLTLILGPVKQMKEHLEQGSEAMSYVGLIESNVSRIQRMISQLLQFREIESQKITMDPRPGELVGFLKSIFSLFEFYSNRKNIEMEFVAEEEPLYLAYDQDAVEKVFTNLISNAIKYTPDGNFIGVRVSRMQEDGMVRIDVTNTGSSIPDERKAELFQAFSRYGKTADRSFETSTGLGLAIVKELVSAMGGTVGVDSSDLKVTFSVRLPLKPARNDLAPESVSYDYTESEIDSLIESLDDQEQEPESAGVRKRYTIVVMEDDTALRRYLKSVLSEHYNVYTAHDGEEGMALLSKYDPDLVMTDLTMPGLDGFEVCRRIRADFKTSHIPVVVLSAQGSVDDTRARAIESGANMFIDKPVDMDFLTKQIGNLLRTREQLREYYGKKFVAEPSKLTITSMDEDLLRRAMSCIEKNMDNNDYDVNEFVSDMAVGRTILYKKIKDITGMSIKEFIMDIRLKRGAQLLKDSEMTVSEISDMTGFANQKYFSICFKRHFGLSPSEYKRTVSSTSVQEDTISVQ